MRRRITPQQAYLAGNMVRAVITDGTGKPVLTLPFYCAGKTGTTDECVRGWFVGYARDLLCVVYMGYDNPQRSLGVRMTGSKTALPVWMEFMGKAFEKRPDLFGEFPIPDGIEFAKINTLTGFLADQDGENVETFPFLEGTVPVQSDDGINRGPYSNDLRSYITAGNAGR